MVQASDRHEEASENSLTKCIQDLSKPIEFPRFLAKWLDYKCSSRFYKNTSDELKVRLASLHIEVGDALGWHKMCCGKWRRPEIGEDGFWHAAPGWGRRLSRRLGKIGWGRRAAEGDAGDWGRRTTRPDPHTRTTLPDPTRHYPQPPSGLSISIMGSSAFSLRQSRKRLAQCFLKGYFNKMLPLGLTPFGYTRKDVLLIGLGVTVAGIGLESGLEYLGVDPLQAGNVVQLVLVLGLTVGWISTYIFRVSNKEMTYAQQLRDYEVKVMEKRLESLTEAEIEALLEQVEEEKRRLAGGEQMK
ncbi:hypothetical protein Sango_1713600 [Sesamum angolense]|uniref:Uncharacterized protein n=1 Tax=Sesamum angolense TaxID=2727404 RepID=A0AAE1WM31_9LAMI|nr:hypothetical protein Sango_1713600 [Sesamum angolense]